MSPAQHSTAGIQLTSGSAHAVFCNLEPAATNTCRSKRSLLTAQKPPMALGWFLA